jgi:hypothetical protein
MSGGVPAGWVLVPVEPTEAMVEAAIKATKAGLSPRNVVYDAIAATPTPPIEGRDADVERERLAKSLYWADVKLGENADRIRDEWLESWWTECSTMPLSGPGFLRKWFALADAALQALGERG